MIGLRISGRAARLAVDRGYAASSPVAMEMHQRLVHPTSRDERDRLVVHAEPDWWSDLAAWCDDQSYVEYGATRREQLDAAVLSRAAATIRRELGRLAKHPAYRGVGVRGVDRRALPAFRCGSGRWWPTTALAKANSDGTTLTPEAATLYPRTVRQRGQVFTVWSPDRDREGP